MKSLYHVTLRRDLPSILEKGIQPRIGPRSLEMGEVRPAVHLFHDLVDVEDAICNWLGDRMDGDIALLQIVVDDEDVVVGVGTGFETIVTTTVAPSSIRTLCEDVDDFEFATSAREDGKVTLTSETLEDAKRFLFERWRERQAERFPGRPAPVDLSDSCKFSSAFACKLFGGRVVANERHQFVVQGDGTIVDLNVDAADVRAMDWPYEEDPSMLAEPDWIAAMESVSERVDEWTRSFVAGRDLVHGCDCPAIRSPSP